MDLFLALILLILLFSGASQAPSLFSTLVSRSCPFSLATQDILGLAAIVICYRCIQSVLYPPMATVFPQRKRSACDERLQGRGGGGTKRQRAEKDEAGTDERQQAGKGSADLGTHA